jgi:uncharacterized protein with beta-barrel porin domain
MRRSCALIGSEMAVGGATFRGRDAKKAIDWQMGIVPEMNGSHSAFTMQKLHTAVEDDVYGFQ